MNMAWLRQSDGYCRPLRGLGGIHLHDGMVRVACARAPRVRALDGLRASRC